MGLNETPGSTWQLGPGPVGDFQHLQRLRSLSIKPAEVIETRDFLIQFFRDEDPNISVAGAERIVDHLIRRDWLSDSAYSALGRTDADPS